MLILVQWLIYFNDHRVIVSSVWNFMQYCIVWCKEKGKITQKEEGGFFIFHVLICLISPDCILICSVTPFQCASSLPFSDILFQGHIMLYAVGPYKMPF